MRKTYGVVIACTLVLGLALAGCGEKKAASSKEAIAEATSKGTPQEQADYLATQAKAFISAKEYQNAISCAKEALNLDANNEEAQSLIERAKSEMAAKAEEMKKDAEGSMEGAKEKLGGLLEKAE